MVIRKSVMKYMTRMGQNTGTLKTWKNVQNRAISVDFVTLYQNLNSGNLRINGLNSSFAFVGRDGPSSSSSSCPKAGSILGVRKARNKLR